MTDLKIPVGISDFAKIRNYDYYYVDKTGLIEELLENETAEVTLITRPRRFGCWRRRSSGQRSETAFCTSAWAK